ncbi:hypothetical protein AB4292_17365 [Vibrio cyclitrophicus]
MEISEKLMTAIIAGGVSLFVALISFVTNVYQNKMAEKKLKTEIKNKFTEKLYEKRIELYPKAFLIVSKIQKRKAPELIISKDLQANVLTELNLWAENEAGLFLSKDVIKSYYSLRKELGNNPGDGEKYTKIQADKIWKARTNFRSALRSDIAFLHYK